MSKKSTKTLREWCIENNKQDLIDEWDYEKNGELTPDNITPFANKKVWWICSKDHQWKALVSKRTDNRNCPYCANKKVWKGDNDLETWCKKNGMEHLLVEWDYSKNKSNPDELLPCSNDNINWKCSVCGGEWTSKLSNRTHQKHGCVYCSHQKVLKGVSDFETFCKKENRLELLKMWSPKNKKLPSEIFPATHKKFEWVCEKGHTWKSSVADMTIRDNDFCPQCFSSGSSFIEKVIAFYIAKYFDIQENYRPDFLNGKEIDIYIPTLKTGIEYDGYYYHLDVDKDNDKNLLCIQNGINLIRIREYGLPLINNCKSYYLSKSLKKGFPNNFEMVLQELLSFLDVDNPIINISNDRTKFLDFAKKQNQTTTY